MVKVAILLPSIGAVEVLPHCASPADVLHAQGQIIRTNLSATCQLFWATNSAYLLEQVNAFCSTLTGELVRGDAVLTAEHGSPAAAQAWIRETSSKHSSTNSLNPCRRQKGPVQRTKARACCSDAEQSAAASSVLEERDALLPIQVENVGGAAKPRETAATQVTSTQQHPASAIPDDGCEPRSKLLWQIVGQASSVTWARPSVGSAESTEGMANGGISYAATPLEASAAKSEAVLQPAPPPQNAPESLSVDVWSALQQELVVVIASKLKAPAVQAMVHTCRRWRSAVYGDRRCLQKLSFHQPSSTAPLSKKFREGAECPCSTGLPITLLADKQQSAASVLQAAKAGNLSACLAAANLLSRLGLADGMRFWRRAAQLGDPRAQVVYGTGAYSGAQGLVRDSDEAYRWLSKATTSLAALPSTLANGALMARAALHLGFLALDGEATKLDLESAVSWFRLAAKYGSRDAEVALGTLLRTGQYGPS